jgi:hypothetical protein
MICLQVVDGGESLQKWTVAAKMLNKYGHLARSGPPAWGFGEGLKNPNHKN